MEYDWPRIPGLTVRLKRLWKKAILQTFTDVREKIKQEYIANEWEYEAQKYLKWWMSDEEDRVYQQTNQGINVRSVCL